MKLEPGAGISTGKEEESALCSAAILRIWYALCFDGLAVVRIKGEEYTYLSPQALSRYA